MTITVVTPSLPTRAHLLAEAILSVNAQTLPPVEHLIGVDHGREGSAALRNRLAAAARGEWVAFLDDDDVLHPHHLETLAVAADADVVYSRPDGYDPVQPFDPDRLRAGNFIPVTVLARRELFLEAGGFDEAAPHGWEDWGAWLRMLDHGARFRFVDEVTWTYRLHPGSKTLTADPY